MQEQELRFECFDCEDGVIVCTPDELASEQCPTCKSKSSLYPVFN